MKKLKPRVLLATFGNIDKSLLRYYGDDHNLRNNRKFFREKTDKEIRVTDKETYLSLPKEIILKGMVNIVITDDLNWVPEPADEQGIFYNVTTPWQALEKAQNVPGEKICIFGNKPIYDFFIRNIIFDELHLTSVNEWFGRGDLFPSLPISLLDNYKRKSCKEFKKGTIDEYAFSITYFQRK